MTDIATGQPTTMKRPHRFAPHVAPRRVWSILALSFACLLSAPVRAEATDVATVLPFVDEQTLAVLRVEPDELPGEVREQLSRLSGFLPAGLYEPVRRALKVPRVTEAYVIATLADARDDYAFVVLDRPDDWTEADTEQLSGETPASVEVTPEAIVIATPPALERLKSVPPSPNRDLVRAAFTESAGAPLQFALALNRDQRRVVGELWQPLLDRHFPIDAKLLADLQWAVVSVSNPEQWLFQLTAETAGGRSADQMWTAIQQDLPGVLEQESLQRQESPPGRLRARMEVSAEWGNRTLETWVKQAAVRRAKFKMRRLGLAMHNHHSAYGRLPPAAVKDADGRPLLSWRVKLLPFLGHDELELYRQFHLDEPWDSPHNRPLAAQMPDVFRLDPTSPHTERSTVVAPVGEAMMFHSDEPKFKDVIDGLSNTIMLVEVPEAEAEIWTKPGGKTIDPDKPAEGLGGHFGDNNVLVLFGDGSVKLLDLTKHRDQLHGMFTRNAGEIFRVPLR